MKNQMTTENPVHSKFPTIESLPDVLDITQMCAFLQISSKTGYHLLSKKKIKALKVGRAYRIPKVHLLSYLQINTTL